MDGRRSATDVEVKPSLVVSAMYVRKCGSGDIKALATCIESEPSTSSHLSHDEGFGEYIHNTHIIYIINILTTIKCVN